MTSVAHSVGVDAVFADAAERLPAVSGLRVTFKARRAQRVPGLVTTALHGALGRLMRGIACSRPRGTPCDACEEQVTCAHAMAFEPKPREGTALGVTTRPPSALVLAPAAPYRPRRYVELKDEQRLDVLVTLIGDAARETAPLLVHALESAGRIGLGVEPKGPRDPESRPELDLVSAERVPYPADAEPTDSIRVTFTSPVRLTVEGQPAEVVTGRTLLRAVVRRAELLSRTYGDGPLFETPASAIDGVETTRVNLERAVVNRWSSRQRRRMTWPALTGFIDFRGPEVAAAWPLLKFCEAVQVGKGTSFGFGRFEISVRERGRD